MINRLYCRMRFGKFLQRVLGFFCLRYRQCKGKRAAFIHFRVLKIQITAHTSGKVSGYKKAKASPRRLAWISAGDLREFREKFLLIGIVDTYACIGNGNIDIRMSFTRVDNYSAALGEFYGIGDKVYKNLLELVKVGWDGNQFLKSVAYG